MIPTTVGLLVIGLGVLLVYVGVHGGGFLAVEAKPSFGSAGAVQ